MFLTKLFFETASGVWQRREHTHKKKAISLSNNLNRGFKSVGYIVVYQERGASYFKKLNGKLETQEIIGTMAKTKAKKQQ